MHYVKFKTSKTKVLVVSYLLLKSSNQNITEHFTLQKSQLSKSQVQARTRQGQAIKFHNTTLDFTPNDVEYLHRS